MSANGIGPGGVRMGFPPGNEFTDLRYQEDIRVFEVDYATILANNSAVMNFPIEPGMIMTGVGYLVQSAFDASVTMTVGTSQNGTETDTDDQDDCFEAGTDVATANVFAWNNENLNFVSLGLLHVTLSTKTITKGRVLIFVKSFNLGGDWRIPAAGVKPVYNTDLYTV